MDVGLTSLLAQFSDAITARVTASAPLLAAIRIGANRHVSGIIWRSDLILTSDQCLPVSDGYTVVLPGGALRAARAVTRDPASNLVLLKLEGAAAPVAIRPPAEPAVGGFVLVLGADAAAAPVVRAGIIHRSAPGGGERPVLCQVLTLDLPCRLQEEGGPVLDAAGGLLGMAMCGAEDEALVVPYESLARLVAGQSDNDEAPAKPNPASPFDDRPAPEHAIPEQPIPEQATAGQATPQQAPQQAIPELAVGGQPAADHAVLEHPCAGRQPSPQFIPPAPQPAGPRGWLGVSLRPMPVPDRLRAAAGCRVGRMVLSLSPNGPADQAGLEPGDLLLSLDGISIGGPNALRSFLGPERVGRPVAVKLARSGELLTVRLTVQPQPAAQVA